MSAPEEEKEGKAPERIEMYYAANAHGVMTSAVRWHRGTAERDVAENTVTFPQYAPHRVVRLVELREGDLFVRAEEMEAAVGQLADVLNAGLEDSLDWRLREFATVILNSLRQWRATP